MGLTLAWRMFHGIDVAEVFYPLIDVAVAIFATGTQNRGNPSTRTSISRKASHTDAKLGEPGHTNVNLEERRHANAKPKERDPWNANHSGGPGMPRA